MDEATATPIAPPRFCEVLSRPEATPASCSVTLVSAPMEIGMKAKAVPMPATKEAASAQKVSSAAAEEQEAGEGQPVGGDHPLEARFGEMQLAADGREGGVDDREIYDGDEVGPHQQGEGPPALAQCLERLARPGPGG